MSRNIRPQVCVWGPCCSIICETDDAVALLKAISNEEPAIGVIVSEDTNTQCTEVTWSQGREVVARLARLEQGHFTDLVDEENVDFNSMNDDLITFLENLKNMAPVWKKHLDPDGGFTLLLD